MRKIIIIDIGSNSVRMNLLNIDPSGGFKIMNDIKESVRLAAGMDINNRISDEYINKAITTLKSFKKLADSVEADDIIAVATEAVRKASNREDFVTKVKQSIDLDIQVLSGSEEAYYDYFAARSSIDFDDGLIMDIGGASTELGLVKNRELVQSISIPYGSLNLTQMFGTSDKVSAQQETSLKFFLFEQFRKIEWLEEAKPKYLIGIGGTIRNVAEIDRIRKNYPLDITHNYHMKTEDMHAIFENAKIKDLAGRCKIPGLSKSRADIFIAPCAFATILCDFCGIEDILISGSGLREGIIYSYLAGQGINIESPLDFSIRSTMLNYQLNERHSQKIFEITNSLLEQLQPVHKLTEGLEKVIKTAAFLHDCGINVSYYNHHQHSFYMLLNSGVFGLTHRELLMSAYVAGAHRRHFSRVDTARYGKILSGDDVLAIKKLGIILSIAESLDRNMSGSVETVNCTIRKNKIYLNFTAKDDLTLEIKDAEQFRSNFKNVFGYELILPGGEINV